MKTQGCPRIPGSLVPRSWRRKKDTAADFWLRASAAYGVTVRRGGRTRTGSTTKITTDPTVAPKPLTHRTHSQREWELQLADDSAVRRLIAALVNAPRRLRSQLPRRDISWWAGPETSAEITSRSFPISVMGRIGGTARLRSWCHAVCLAPAIYSGGLRFWTYAITCASCAAIGF